MLAAYYTKRYIPKTIKWIKLNSLNIPMGPDVDVK